MELLNSIFSWIIKKRVHQIELFKKYPNEVQNEWFSRLIDTSKNTEWGVKFEYKSIKTIQEYKNRVPIQDYDSLKPYITRIKNGEQNLLWPTEIRWFAQSSGSENEKSKFIPISKESLEECHYNGGKDLISIYYNSVEDSNLFGGKSLMLGGSSSLNMFENNSYYGDLSAIIMKNLPFWAEFRRTPSLSIALMDEWEEKMERMAQTTIHENVISISGVPSWGLVLLKRILEITKTDDISNIWPNLELFVHGGVSFTPYKKQFKNLISSPKMKYMETYNASEGFFGIQDVIGEDGMLLMLDYGIFYEFLPLDQLGSDFPQTLQLDEVSLNTDYAMVISTNAGLWRYSLGDTIRFTSLNPYKIIITGRTKHFINAFGEELMIHNVESALKIATSKTSCMINDYTVGPIFMNDKQSGGHEWLIEFSAPPENLNYFNEVLDNALKSINSDYEAKRYKNMALAPPIIKILQPGTFFNWMKQRGKLGGQHKVPRLYNNRKYIDEILTFAKSFDGLNHSLS